MAYIDAFVIGWMTIDAIANVLLYIGANFTKLRFFGTTFLTRREAILVAYAQVGIAMIASFYIVDWIFAEITVTMSKLVPITLAMIGFFHLYILSGLPYKITIRRVIPSGLLLALAFFAWNSVEISTYIASLFQSK